MELFSLCLLSEQTEGRRLSTIWKQVLTRHLICWLLDLGLLPFRIVEKSVFGVEGTQSMVFLLQQPPQTKTEEVTELNLTE